MQHEVGSGVVSCGGGNSKQQTESTALVWFTASRTSSSASGSDNEDLERFIAVPGAAQAVGGWVAELQHNSPRSVLR